MPVARATTPNCSRFAWVMASLSALALASLLIVWSDRIDAIFARRFRSTSAVVFGVGMSAYNPRLAGVLGRAGASAPFWAVLAVLNSVVGRARPVGLLPPGIGPEPDGSAIPVLDRYVGARAATGYVGARAATGCGCTGFAAGILAAAWSAVIVLAIDGVCGPVGFLGGAYFGASASVGRARLRPATLSNPSRLIRSRASWRYLAMSPAWFAA